MAEVFPGTSQYAKELMRITGLDLTLDSQAELYQVTVAHTVRANYCQCMTLKR